LNKKLYKIML